MFFFGKIEIDGFCFFVNVLLWEVIIGGYFASILEEKMINF